MAASSLHTDIPILDTHIHLYPESELSTLSWCPPTNPLAGQHAPTEYKAAISPSNRPFRGAIFVETDRKHDITCTPPNYDGVFDELRWLKRVITGEAKEGEGHGVEHKGLLAAVVPWAPLPLGKEGLVDYLTQAEEIMGKEAWPKVRGFRYLLQDKPPGTGTTDKFIEGLKELGKRGYSFEVGVDVHRRGRKQLDEALAMVERAHEGVEESEKVVFILNHLCKPDFSALHPADPSFLAWKQTLYALSSVNKVYMKLSGGFSEMSDRLKQAPADQIFMGITPWLSPLLATFGPRKTMFGSDWPVCTVGVEVDASGKDKEKEAGQQGEEGGEKAKETKEAFEGENAWVKWKEIVERFCYMGSLEKEDLEWLWYKTAMEAYHMKE